MTGVKTKDEFLASPDAQEQYMNHLTNSYKEGVSKLKTAYSDVLSKNTKDETLMLLQHFLGYEDANLYLRTLKNTGKDYDAAQSAVDDAIKKRLGYIPKNMPIKDYLIKFNERLSKQTT